MAEFQDLQLDTTDYRSLYTQRESARGVADISKPILRRKDVNTDGDGFDPSQRFVERMPDGFGAPTDVALLGEEGTFGGNLLPRYLELLYDMPLLCGVNARKSQVTLPDGRIKEVWEFPEGPRNIATESGWFGSEGEVWALKYGKLMSLMIETERDGDTGGNKSMHFSRVQRNATLPSVTAQNAKFRVSAANVAGPVGLSIIAPGLAAKTVSIAIGDNAATIAASFLAQGLTATVTGGVAVGAGEVHAVNGTGPLSVYGIDVFSKTIATLQTAIRALDAAHSTAVVAGTITQAVAGTNVLTISGAGLAAANGNNYVDVGAGPDASTRKYSNGAYDVLRTSGYWVIRASGSSTDQYASTASGVATPDTTYATGDGAVGPAPAPIVTSAAGGGAPASATLTITYDAAAGNIPDLVFVGAGYTGASTQSGGAGGTVDIEFTNPGNVPIAVNKASGDANYLLSMVQQGRDGAGYDEIGGPEIHATHWLVFKAATLAALNALDMGDANTPADEETLALVQTATGHNVSFENLCQAIYVEDGKINPGTHITRRATVTSSLTLLAQRTVEGNTGIDYAEDVYATDNAGGCGTIPFWLRYAARCASYEMWIDGKWSRNQQAAHPAKEGAAQWQFPLTRIHDRAGSLLLTFIYPAQ